MNELGPFLFRSFHGDPPLLLQQKQLFTRAGLNGTAIWKTGIRAERFTLRSLAGVANIFAGRVLLRQYGAMADYTSPSVLIWSGISTAAEKVLVDVLAVRQVSLRSVLNDTEGYGALLEAEWDLQMVPVNLDDEEE